MEAPLHTGRWQIAAHLVDSDLWAQILACPHGQHDDGPDAMERAGWSLANRGPDLAGWFGEQGVYR